MRSMLLSLAPTTTPFGWFARFAGIAVSNFFLLASFLALANEYFHGNAGINIVSMITITLTGCILGWRWEQFGGRLVILGGFAQEITAFMAFASPRNYLLAFILAGLYTIPFVAIGMLYVHSSKIQSQTSA